MRGYCDISFLMVLKVAVGAPAGKHPGKVACASSHCADTCALYGVQSFEYCKQHHNFQQNLMKAANYVRAVLLPTKSFFRMTAVALQFELSTVARLQAISCCETRCALHTSKLKVTRCFAYRCCKQECGTLSARCASATTRTAETPRA